MVVCAAMMSKTLFRFVSVWLLHPWQRLRRPMTLGVRVMVLDARDRVMLIRHRHSPGWLLPGGGVERGETIWEAGVRETREESGVKIIARPRLFGFYNNDAQMRGDHLALLVAREFEALPFSPNFEIAEARFFGMDELPGDVTGGTRRRLAEVLEGAEAADRW